MADKCGILSYNELIAIKLERDIDEASSSLKSTIKQEDFCDEHLFDGKGMISQIKIENNCSIHGIPLLQVKKTDVESDSTIEKEEHLIIFNREKDSVDDVIEDTMKTSETSVLVEDNQDLHINLQTKGTVSVFRFSLRLMFIWTKPT